MTKEDEIISYLQEKVFSPILESAEASSELKRGVNITIQRMKRLAAPKMVQYYWSAIIGTERSTEFARQMRQDGFTRFEEVIDEFRDKFGDQWIRAS